MVQIVNRAAISVALIALGVILYSCGDADNSITDCSKRGLPQHYDGKKWTCKK